MKSKLSLLILAAFVVFTFNSCGSKKTKEELRKEKIEELLYKSQSNSISLRLYNRIQKYLNDPNSMELLGLTYVDKDSVIVVTQKFTAKNGFGGTLRKEVIVTVDTLGNFIEVNKWFK